MDNKPSENAPAATPEQYQRFGLQFRLQHFVLFTSVIALCATGVPLWFLGRPQWVYWTQNHMQVFGSIETVRCIHQIAAIILMALAAYHTIWTIVSPTGRREFIALIPMPKDIAAVWTQSLYFLHLSEKRPQFGRFSYFEKFDYWAVYWGCVILFVTGLVMWFGEDAMSYIPIVGPYIPDMPYKLAALIHADEAILCALALFIWHFYNVHWNPKCFPASWLWWHGRMTREEMLEEHPLELEKIEAEDAKRRGDAL